MSNIRNSQLLQQMQAHPLKATLAKALDAAETFAEDVEFLTLDKNLSVAGKDNARLSKLRAAIRDVRDARAPIAELQGKLDAKRKAVAMPKFDPADTLGFLRRQELRTALRAMSNGQRALYLANPEFADAMLELPPVLSGLHVVEGQPGEDASVVEKTKSERLETLFARQLAEIAALETTIAEANMIADIARNDLQLHSGIDDPRVFNEFVRPIESKANAPWLRRYTEEGKEVIRVIDLENHGARIATEREILDGKYYKDHAEYLADRAAA
jgi:hypothetical protein